MNEYLFVTGEEKHPVKNARVFHVSPFLPEPLKALEKIANNIWWTWNSEAVLLFYRIDRKLWDECNHNPILVLGKVPQKRLEKLASDDSFLSHLKRVEDALYHYMNSSTWYSNNYKDIKEAKIAYFSAEFGIHESLPIYSGGLGILAGDHLKSSSDVGLPLVGMGILYRKGYFQQFLNADGWQKEEYTELHFNQMPFSRIKDKNGDLLNFQIKYPDGMVNVQVWKLQVGRNPLFLLDTDVPGNEPQHREISYHLYGGDLTMRIKQEILLGIGGVRALELMGIEPTTYHMNEGHSAFLALERLKHLMHNEGLDYGTAKKVVRSSSVFTTHTPVPAGNDSFPPQLMDAYLSEYYRELGLNRENFLALGRKNPGDFDENFCMTVLALKLSSHANGVSRLHGNVSRDMWSELYPSLPKNEVPVDHITNGIHTCTWISPDVAQLYDRYLGPRWREEPMNLEIFERIQNIPADELWRTHERRRERLVSFTRDRVKSMIQRNGGTSNELRMADEILDPEALTIGFARRFATYKRGTLLFSDIERLKKIVNDKNKPVQFIFAGKAHPKDNGGKSLIKDIVHIVRNEGLSNKIVFLENYDINVARYLVAGVDVWLNNPRRPLEASGTSGMKVPVNGGINLSVLDGWWCESYNGVNGWAIGNGEEYEDHDEHDEIESKALYDLLERDVVPTFYDRQGTSVPRRWIEIMKNSMMTVCPVFSTNRMVSDYFKKFYINCHKQYVELKKSNYKAAHELAQLHEFLHHNWSEIEVAHVSDSSKGEVTIGKSFTITSKIHLGNIKHELIDVQVYKGYLDSRNQIINGRPHPMKFKGIDSQGLAEYTCEIESKIIGHNGYAIRILPHHDQLFMKYHPYLITWA